MSFAVHPIKAHGSLDHSPTLYKQTSSSLSFSGNSLLLMPTVASITARLDLSFGAITSVEVISNTDDDQQASKYLAYNNHTHCSHSYQSSTES
jgi:hypothetical protein